MNTRIISLGLLLVVGAPAQAAPATKYGCPIGAAAQQVADDYNRRWLQAVESGNTAELGALYADNAVLMPPTDVTIVGRAPIEAYLTTTQAPRLTDYSVDIVACDMVENTLRFAGVWGAQQIDYRGQAITMTGNIVRILDRQADGSYVFSYEIWN